MNKGYHLSNQMQFDYFLNSINKRKRHSKQAKKTITDDAKDISNYFGYSLKKAEEALSVLTPVQIKTIKEKLQTGG
jgi:hypothetical protein